jgi:RimJ/RimL family protein N-acetyltransferase
MPTDRLITLSSPDFAAVSAAPVADDVAVSRDHWLALAQQGHEGVIYFSIYLQDNGKSRLVGQIFLHDYDKQSQEALVGYHLFQTQDRGQGIGTAALRLLVYYVVEQTAIQQLVIITDVDNHASQRIAEKCGLTYRGPAREGLPLICYTWQRTAMQ